MMRFSRHQLRRRILRWLTISGMSVTVASAQQTPSKTAESPSVDDLYETGKALFDQLAPPEIKEQFEFPSKQQWDAFAVRLQTALEEDDLTELAAFLPEAKAALAAVRVLPGYEDYADWLQERVDYIEAADGAAKTPPPRPVPVRPPSKPGERPTTQVFIPYYDLWVKRMNERPVPARAEQLLPAVQAAFKAEGVPVELAWIAETESTFNPGARSPAGAKGLFQLMPDTAKGLGLKTFLPDERDDTEKSARAAARYLRTLHNRFGEWPLAFAAYNAGEGRVSRLLKKHDGSTFASIASALPSETRMYVPKLCATIAVRAGVAPDKLLPPSAG